MDRNRRSRSRSRDRGGNREKDRDGRDRDTKSSVVNNARTDRERYDRERVERDARDRESKAGAVAVAIGGAVVNKPLSKEEQEAKRQERLALVKRMTQGANSDDEGAGEGIGGAKEKVEGEEEEDEEAEMARLMGFGDFSTTKGKQIDDNTLGAGAGAVAKHKARKYRQYMNRKSGFNRPLAKMD